MSQIPPPPQPPYPQQPGMPPPGMPGGPGGPATYSMPPQRGTSGAAVASLILGILGCVPLITGLLAIVCGIIGVNSTRDGRRSGRGMAVAGIILGLISLIAWGAVFGLGGWGAWKVQAYTKEQRAAARQFASDLAAGNVGAAQARCTNQVKPEELKAAADKLKKWGAFQDTTMPVGSVQTVNGKEESYVGGMATFASQSVPYLVGYRKEDGEWKVTGFMFTGPDGAVTGGVEPKQTSHRSSE